MTDEKKTQTHVVTIKIPSDRGGPFTQNFYVRHHTPASARNWLLDDSVETRVATQDDIEFMVKAGIEPAGLAKAKPAGEPEQVDAYPDPPPVRDGHID